MTREVTAYRWLMVAIAVALVLHVLAPVGMVALLGPGVDTHAPVAARAAFVAAHAWRWRLGWLPWQLTAASDLGLGVALIAWTARTPGRRGLWAAIASLAITLLAVLPDQTGEALFVTRAVEVARRGDAAAYLALEARLLLLTGTCAAALYALMGAAWSVAVAQATGGVSRRRGFVLAGAAIWALFLVAAVVNAQATRAAGAGYPGYALNVALNGAGFGLLTPWLLWVAILVGEAHHARHPADDAALLRLAWPTRSLGGCLAALATAPGMCDLARVLRGVLPRPVLVSDVRDVVILNWLVPVERARALLPRGLRLHELDGLTAVSILTYTHGGFGPRVLGPLRRFLPSPLQSNWRLYLANAEGRPDDAVWFWKTCLDRAPHVIGSRLLADGLPAHLARITMVREGERISTVIDPGAGSAPDLRATVRVGVAPALPAAFAARFASYDAAIRYLVEQDRARSCLPALGLTCDSLISIPMAPADLEPAAVEGTIESAFLRALVDGCEPLALVVRRVPFASLGERFEAS